MGKQRKKRRPAKPVTAPSRADTALLERGPVDRRGDMIRIAVILGTALAVRLVYFFINSRQNPVFYYPVLDARFHHDWALEILAGNFWGDEVFFRAPLYPYFLAFLYKLSGASMAFAVLVQHVIGSVSCVVVYYLARHFFATRVALVAGLLAALYWPLVYFEGDLLIVTLVILLDLLALHVLVGAAKEPRPRRFVMAGLLLGLSAIARPSILIFIPLIPVCLYQSGRSPSDRNTRRFLIRQSMLVGVGLAVIITPVIVRNYVVGRDVVPIASQGGVNFYIGNNPEANGSFAQVPGTRPDLYGSYRGAIDLAEKEAGRRLKPSEVSNHYFKKGFDFITSSPGDAASLTARKIYLFWAGPERSNSKYIQFFWKRFGLGRVPLPGFWLVGPLSLLGGVLLWPRRRELSFLYIFVVMYMVGVIVFFVNGRFRLPVVPVLIVFAAYAACYLYTVLRRSRGELPKVLAILVVCVFVVDYDYVKSRGVRAIDEAVSYYTLGEAYLRQNQKAKALAAYEDAYGMQQRYPTRAYAQIAGQVDYQLGVLYKERGYTSRAIAALERIQPNSPAAAQAYRELAPLYEQMRRYEDANRAYQMAVSSSPRDAESLLGLARTYKLLGNTIEFERTIEHLLANFSGEPRVESRVRELQRTP